MPFSKTDLPCDCNYLQNSADDPDRPIEFDTRHHVFQFVYPTEHGQGKMMIYHCPFCGGKAPEARRVSLFSKLSRKEQFRLIEMTKSLKTLDAVLQALGLPDSDKAVGEIITIPEKDGQPAETRTYRTLEYTKLSETANVHIRVYPTEHVAISFRGKYLGDII